MVSVTLCGISYLWACESSSGGALFYCWFAYSDVLITVQSSYNFTHAWFVTRGTTRYSAWRENLSCVSLNIHTRDTSCDLACRENNHAWIYIFTRVMLLVLQRVEKNNHAWIYIFTRIVASRVCAWKRKYPRVKISCENKYRAVMPIVVRWPATTSILRTCNTRPLRA